MERYLIVWMLLIIILHCLSMQFYQVLSSSSSIYNPNNLSCPDKQSHILLQFKLMFTIADESQICGYYDQKSYPKTLSWNENSTNCCSWDGVSCDDLTGDVIGIDLGCSQLSGTFHPNTTLFQLPSLTSLNLAFNNFQQSIIPSSIGMLASTLTHLNISTSSFAGPIPSEIAHLSKLVVLDITENDSDPYGNPSTHSLRIKQHDFQNIINNLTQLEYLYLSRINMSSNSIIPDSIVNLTSLTSLSLLGNIGLYGQVPDGVFNLPALQKLYIWNNYGLKGSFHNVNWNISGISLPLVDLELSSISLSGGLPDSIGHLRSLKYLLIENCNLSGSLPGSIGNLSQLISLSFSSNNLSGLIPHSLSNLNELKMLHLSYNSFVGQIPTDITSLKNLFSLFMNDNLFRGSVPSDLVGLPNLVYLVLDNNMLSGTLSSFLFNNNSNLSYFDLSRNNMSGPIPQSISNLTKLYYLDLSFNNFDGTFYLDTVSNLGHVHLGHNSKLLVVDTDGNFSTIISLELSLCNLINFPIKFLSTSNNLEILDLSNTGVSGQIPEWIGEMRNMSRFLASNNTIKGEIPSSICNMSSLMLLDLSQNDLHGSIPPCFGNFSTKLSVLDLQKNNLQGGIPTTYARDNMLTTLALNENQLQGPVPISLSMCNHLQVLNFGNNMINGTFPSWVDILPELEVLMLRSNKFHGSIDISKTPSPFPKLRIFDISHNEFTGLLPSCYFNSFSAMKTVNQKSTRQIYMYKEDSYKYPSLNLTYYYNDSVTITTKGLDRSLEGIFHSWTIIDLSSNKFEGVILDVVGELVELTLLNMSNNRFTGPIPESLGNLVQLQHLDLSSNHLTGEIPRQLTSLTFLAVLNLSCNRLEGRIPQGKQFDTFSNTSYLENKALCGLPLSRKCQEHEIPTPSPHDHSEDDSDYAFMSGFTWQAVLMGYASGMIIGLGGGCFSFYMGRPKWFVTMINEDGYKMIKKYRRVGRISSLMRLH